MIQHLGQRDAVSAASTADRASIRSPPAAAARPRPHRRWRRRRRRVVLCASPLNHGYRACGTARPKRAPREAAESPSACRRWPTSDSPEVMSAVTITPSGWRLAIGLEGCPRRRFRGAVVAQAVEVVREVGHGHPPAAVVGAVGLGNVDRGGAEQRLRVGIRSFLGQQPPEVVLHPRRAAADLAMGLERDRQRLAQQRLGLAIPAAVLEQPRQRIDRIRELRMLVAEDLPPDCHGLARQRFTLFGPA